MDSEMLPRTTLALFAWLVAGPATAGAVSEIPFEKYLLEENGLEVILHQDQSLPIVAVNIWYHAGPINEAPGRTGFAHLFEHLMFQGSKNVADDQHFKLLEGAGASTINGSTDYDRTNYFETVPANQLELALWLESDRMGFLLDTLNDAKLQNQREVVKNERRQVVDNRPYGPSDEKLIQTIFSPDHPYFGAVIGSMADLEAATLADVREFFTSYYAPANATLVIAGDIDIAAAKALVEKYFGSLPRRDAPAARAVDTRPITKQERVEVVEPVMLPMVQIAWHSPPLFAPGDAEADVLALTLGGGKSSRMHRRLVYELEIAQQVSVEQESNTLASIFRVTVTGRPGVELKVIEAETWSLLREIRDTRSSPQEVKRARNMLMTRSLAGLQRVGAVADRLNLYNQYINDPSYLATDLARYDAVTPETLQRFARELLEPQRSVVVWTSPRSEKDGRR